MCHWRLVHETLVMKMFICIFDGTINWIFKLCLPKYRALWYTWNTGIYIYMCVCVGIICFYFIFMKNLLIWREIGQFEQRSVIIGEFANIGENLLTWWENNAEIFFFWGGGIEATIFGKILKNINILDPELSSVI